MGSAEEGRAATTPPTALQYTIVVKSQLTGSSTLTETESFVLISITIRI